MLQKSRRSFLSVLTKAAALTGFASLAAGAAHAGAAHAGAAQAGATIGKAPKKAFVHHVYFWLKNPESAADKAKLIEGLRKLSKVKTIKEAHIGVPADTNREVIDSSYAVSWLLMFDDKAAQDSYQTDPIHLDFVKEYSPLWNKVIVYDSVDV